MYKKLIQYHHLAFKLGIMKFRKKKEVLEYLGKNEKDVRLLDRMMSRWELVRENGMYILIDDKKALIEEIKNLREQLSKVSNPDLENELYEAKVQWEYWEWVARRYNTLMDLVIKTVYSKIKPLLWSRLEDYEVFREWVIEDVKKIEKSD